MISKCTTGNAMARPFRSPPDAVTGARQRTHRWPALGAAAGCSYHRGMSSDFPAFALSPEHEALRESVRQLADDKIAPHAAKVDQSAQFPIEAHDALVKSDLHAVHIPEEYGGAGADAIATAIVIE